MAFGMIPINVKTTSKSTHKII